MIFIAGDSWGEGYYQTDPASGAKWPGFHHYWIKNNQRAVNISHGGNSNHQTLSELQVYLTNKRNHNRLRVIVWLTCVLRDYPTDHDVGDIDHWVYRHYENIFDRCTSLAHQHRCTIELLGGLGDIPRLFPHKITDRVQIRLHSVPAFIDNNYQFEMPYGHITQVDGIPDMHLKSKLLDQIQPKHEYLTDPNGHFPAGHPGPIQYSKVFEFLNHVQSKI